MSTITPVATAPDSLGVRLKPNIHRNDIASPVVNIPAITPVHLKNSFILSPFNQSIQNTALVLTVELFF